MSSKPFKTQIAADIFDTFLNESEFADLHSIDGNTVTALLDTSRLFGAQGQEGVFQSAATLYVHADDFSAKPVTGQMLDVDGSKYEVLTVSDEEGVLVLSLRAYEY